MLLIVTGDFNWVTKEADRVDLHNSTHSGGGDGAEEIHWHEQVAQPAGLRELAQPEFTFRSEDVRSRLDRAYTSHHDADFFAGVFWAAAWPWPSRNAAGWAVSDHRPITFGFRRPPADGRPPALQAGVVNHPDFGRRVAKEYHFQIKRRVRSGHKLDPMHRLALIKAAMYTVADNMKTVREGAGPLGDDIPATAATAFAI